MSKLLTFLSAFSLTAATASATVHTVQVANFQFSPAALSNVHVGDTVMWVWSNGSHTTTSSTVPAGAATWDAPLTSTSTTYSYKVTAAGSYSYMCTPHAPNMAGSFTATGAATSVETANTGIAFRLFPNPASGTLQLQAPEAAHTVIVSITDAAGRLMSTEEYAGGSTIDISTAGFANGIYVIRATSGGEELTSRFEVSH